MTLTEVLDGVCQFVKDHPGTEVLCYDNPTKLYVGFLTTVWFGEFVYRREFSTSLKELREALIGMDLAQKEMWMTAQGRQRVARLIEAGYEPPFPVADATLWDRLEETDP